jgi:hypothetical protein
MRFGIILRPIRTLDLDLDRHQHGNSDRRQNKADSTKWYCDG